MGPDAARRPSQAARVRILGAAVAMVLSVPLLTARLLSPDPAGLGTHQQLGLPPCSMRVLFDIRCPACGMTTSWSHFMRGELATSLRVNAGGTALAAVAITVVLMGLKCVWTGDWPSMAARKILSVAVVAAGAITVTDWLARTF
ncbi:DUF2752 domain-containing protein [Neorhodopirellula pilleata]|uniref:DUF2752 domain-containing protein n=1 Tax=Neorhodopirellula pilleata TaxID=2714738 RepID=UPI0018CD6CCB|nr:DUF2752 domain-containing protein [Neorhodopirellula pilleata]